MALDDGDAIIDPATLPKNIELIEAIDASSQPQGAPSLDAPAVGNMRELVIEALGVTVAALSETLAERKAPHPLEEDLRGGLAAVLARSGAAVFSEARLRLPGWRGNLGGFDVTVAGTDGSLVLIETKWDNVWQAMWDIFKLASAHQHPRIAAGYAIYAAAPKEWTKFGGDEFFAAGSRSFATDFFLEEYATWWSRNLQGSPTVYPVELPGAISLQAVASNSVILLGKPYEIRSVQVTTSPAKPVTLTRGVYRS